jgi:D-alanine transaminase
VDETPFFQEDLPRLEELFFTGTTTDVQPIVDLDGRPVADGHPGPIATALGRALEERLGVERTCGGEGVSGGWIAHL